MKLLIKILKSRIFWIIFGFTLLVLLIIIAGYLYQWSMERQILSFVVIFLILLIILLYGRFQAARDAGMLEASLKSQADEQAMAMLPAKKEEIEQFKQQLTEAIDALKKSKLGKERSGKAALYALPWYMFIGPPGAGKTTAIEHSGLEFPFGADRIRGVGGTRNCDWFFSSSAILLDTAGRFTTEDEDREEWLAFLDTLKKHRRRKPINGVIVGVSITDIVNASADEIENNASLIRKRIDELIQRLGVRFPVYLVFTKCDLLQGFVNFYEDFGNSERKQIWGCTLTKEQQNDPEPDKVFTKEFHRLYDALEAMRLLRLNSLMNREQRQKTYSFPLQFYAAKDNLSRFITKLFHLNPYQEDPIFRGFYFTSGTQEGVPIDRAIQEIAKQFNLPPEAVKQYDPEMETKSYFIRDLFTKIIIPDQNLADLTSRMARQRGFFKLAMFSVMVIFLTLFTVFIVKTSIRNKMDAQSILHSAHKIQKIQWDGQLLPENFYSLSRFQKQITKLEDPPFLSGSVYQGDRILNSARFLYLSRVDKFVSTYLYQRLLEKGLNDYWYKRGNISKNQAYNYLRCYLLMDNFQDRLSENKADREFLKNELCGLVDTLLNTQFNFSYQATYNKDVESLRPLIKDQVNYFVETLANEHARYAEQDITNHFKINELFVKRIRQRLGKPDIFNTYARIRREGIARFQPLTFRDIMRDQHLEFFHGVKDIPGFFTKNAWEVFVNDEIKEAAGRQGEDDWVLNIKASDLPADALDKEVLENKLKDFYFKEYAKNWWDLLREIKYQPMDNLNIASERIKALGDLNDSPLKQLLKSVTEQTQFEGWFEKKALRTRQTLGINKDYFSIDRKFREIHALNNEQSEKMNGILSQYEDLSMIIEMLASDSDSRSVEYAANILKNRSGEIKDAWQEVHKKLAGFDANIKRTLFEQPIILAWQTILKKAQSYLNVLWYDEVYTNYQSNLGNYYPFQRNSSSVVSLSDVALFLGANGLLNTFINNELSSFINQKTLQPLKWEGYGIRISRQTRNGILKANEISRALGLDKSDNVEVTFSLYPELPSPAGIVNQINLSIEGKQFTYRMGRPKWYSFNWPGSNAEYGAKLEVLTRDESFQISDKTEWGWFKLLDSAVINPSRSTEYKIYWNFSSGRNENIAIKFILKADSRYNPYKNFKEFFQLQLPSSLN